MKKVTKTILITTSIFTFVPLIISGGVGISNSIQKKKINEKILSKDKVIKNFSINGIWENKNFLSNDDLNKFEYIDSDAFDGLSKKIEYVELNNDATINYKNELYENFIKWENVDEIKIFKRSSSSKLISFGNVLYNKIGSRYKTVSITNRKENCNITFPTKSEKEFSGYKIGIVKDFYSIFNFKNNINKISFGDSKYDTLIQAIGDNAFKNCNVLENELSLSVGNSILIIGNESFMNTNITKLSTSGNEIWSSLVFGKNAFKNSSNLSKIDISKYRLVTFDNQSFSMLSRSLSVNLIENIEIYMGNNVFSNIYDDFIYNHISIAQDNTIIFECSPYTFFLINVPDINKFQFNTNCNKDLFIDSGLTDEQYDKINIVNTDAKN